jgi:hypothetical protein
MDKNKANKIAAAKMRSLMERIENHNTYNVAMLNEERMINEAVAGERKQVSRDQILDILNDLDEKGNTRFVSFTYVKALPIYTGKRTWRTDDVKNALDHYQGDKNSKWFQDITNYNDPAVKGTGRKPEDKNPLMNMLITQRYSGVQWLSKKTFNKLYTTNAEKKRNLRMSFGGAIESDGYLGDNHNVRSDAGYGNIQQNQTGRLSHDFNMKGVKSPKCSNYLVDENGKIVDEIDGNLASTMQAKPKEKWNWDNGVPSRADYEFEKSMYDILADDPEKLIAYTKERAEIDKEFRAQTFLLDGILCICATVDGVPYYYINDSISSLSRGSNKPEMPVDSKALVKIAEDQLGKTFQEMSAEAFATEE